MKIKLWCLVLSFILITTGCVKDDLEDLQNQIDDLNTKVDDLEQAQQEALLAAIADLEASLAALNSDLVADLQLLEQEIAENANAVYYGNVITAADYDSLVAQGATIVTGKVVINNDDNIQDLTGIKLIGKNLEINGGTTITMESLQSVGEDLIITGVNTEATLNLSMLSSIGGDFEIVSNTGLTEVITDELVLVSGELFTESNDMLTTLSFAKLDQVDELHINGYWANDPEYLFYGAINYLDLSATNVSNDVLISYVGDVPAISFGEIGGDFEVEYTKIVEISVAASTIGGDFIIEYNARLMAIEVPNLETIDGELSVSFNDNSIFWNETERSGLTTLPTFETLTFIGGDIQVINNGAITSIESFNNVTEMTGANIDFSNNGSNIDNISIFNALVSTGASAYSNASINISEKTNWFDGFNMLENALNVRLTIQAPTEGGGGIGPFEVGGPVRVDGFASMTDLSTLFLDIKEATEFNAFPSLNNFKNYQEYLRVYMPLDENVGMCTMEPIFTKIKSGDFENWNGTRVAKFYMNWTEMDRDTAIDQLLAPCAL
ncbi:coiled-coil domain-containing protein [Marinigracilibium pacificum]|uniref:Receptor L domain-containing protein n=1 Tax=Marinigracilibium pacificum TaxID=2729599 RepID=A0A848J1Z4_9BACT|nr:hypothetical protein [Marinigracilibium pacificum]NMM48329.1 hypothetical protein [Marinigracilibium pacificum]